MEVRGKTLKELLKNLIDKINENAEFSGNSESFSTKFEIKGKDIKDVIERFSNKIVDYYYKKKAVFKELEIEIIPGKKWTLKCYLKGKIYENVEVRIKEFKLNDFEETFEGWKLLFSVEQKF